MADPKASTVSLEEFTGAVDALREMREAGELSLAISRLRGLRLILDKDSFRQKINTNREREVTTRHAGRLLQELGHTTLAVLVGHNLDVQLHAYNLLRGVPFEKDSDIEPATKELLSKKLKHVTEEFITQSLRDRVNRIEDCLSPVLEDMATELVSTRQEPEAEDLGGVPYLRITLTASQPNPGSGGLMIPGPGLFFGPSSSTTFSIECDEHDLDLIMRRLKQAKDLLRTATEESAKNGSR